MTEHENFKEICELVGYEWNWQILNTKYKWDKFSSNYDIFSNVREIIFTPEFKRKFISYYYRVICKEEFELLCTADEIMDEILDHLDDPVSYLYNILWLWNEKEV